MGQYLKDSNMASIKSIMADIMQISNAYNFCLS